MGAAQPAHMLQDMEALEMHDRHFVDESVFGDDCLQIMGYLLSPLHQDRNRLQPARRINPFSKWAALGSPVDDLSWLAFGYDLEKHAYPGEPSAYGYPMDDNGKMVADCERLVKIIDVIVEDQKIPECAKHTVEVARCCLESVAEARFPATPLIAHHYMVDGDFVNESGWAVPIYYKGSGDHAYNKPGQNLVEGVTKLLDVLNLLRPCELLQPLPIDAVRLQHVSTRDRNTRTMVEAGFQRIRESTAKYPDGLVPFWDSDIMDQCIMFAKFVPEFSDDQLALCPMSNTLSYAVFISAYAEYFLVFQRELNPASGLPVVTFWKLDGSMSLDGKEYNLNQKLRVHYGPWNGVWYMKFNQSYWTTGTSLVCELDDGFQREPTLYPMILDLQCQRGNSPPRRNQLIRCVTVPQYIHEAACYPGRGVYDRTAKSWKPMPHADEPWF